MLKLPKMAAAFYRTIVKPDAPTGKVDMYLLHDAATLDGIVSVAVPHGQGEIALGIAKACNGFDGVVALLAEIQWADQDIGGQSMCPICRALEDDGPHKPDCRIMLALKEAEDAAA